MKEFYASFFNHEGIDTNILKTLRILLNKKKYKLNTKFRSMNTCDIYEYYKEKVFEHQPPYNVVTASIFNLGDAGYRNFNKYFNGIKTWLKYLDLNYPLNKYNLYFRLFVDTSVIASKESMFKLLKLNRSHPRLQLVFFDCPNMKSTPKQKHGHAFFFPSLMRLYPMFNYKGNDTDVVFPRDLDMEIDLKDKSTYSAEFRKYVDKMIFDKQMENWVTIWRGYMPDHGITVDNMWAKDGETIGIVFLNSRVKLPISIFNDYLSVLADDSIKDPIMRKVVDSLQKREKTRSRMNAKRPQFFYGIDEIFLNAYVLPYLAKKGKDHSIVNDVKSKPDFIGIMFFCSVAKMGKKNANNVKSDNPGRQIIGKGHCPQYVKNKILTRLKKARKLPMDKYAKEIIDVYRKFKYSGCVKKKYSLQIEALADPKIPYIQNFFYL